MSDFVRNWHTLSEPQPGDNEVLLEVKAIFRAAETHFSARDTEDEEFLGCDEETKA
jgi:hypothetical protein